MTGWPISDMSSTGTTTSSSSGLRIPASTITTGRRSPDAVCPPRKWATSSSGRCVADRPMRCGGVAVISSNRSRESIRWAPRLVVAMAWISSMITVSTSTRVEAADDVSIRYRLSGVVISRSGGRRINPWRSLAGVSPVRMATVGWRRVIPSRSAARPTPNSGERRFFSTSKARARSGEMYSTRVAAFGAGGSLVTRRSMLARNAVSVLPLPVGAHTRVCAPDTMAGHPCACAGVGSGNEAENQARTAGENHSST